MAMPVELNSSPPHQVVTVTAVAERSINHPINQTYGNPEAASYMVKQNPETSKYRGIPESTTETFLMRPISVPTNQSIPVSGNESGAIELLPAQYLSPQPPPLVQPLISNIGVEHQTFIPVVYVPQDQQQLQQTKSGPQMNQSHINVTAVAEAGEDQAHQTKSNSEQVVNSPVINMLRNSLPAVGTKDLKHRASGQLANKAANLANLLPTGTVLAFQALTPSLSNSGKCLSMNKYLVGCTIACCAIACCLSSFTDSYSGSDGKLYYGFVTTRGLCVLNGSGEADEEIRNNLAEDEYKVCWKDFVHALVSVLVFMIFAISSSQVVDCFFPGAGDEEYSVIIYLPLVAGILSSCLFTICPTRRRGIGYTC